jgi:GrpB-like predicted nucleotidyltransferase (UPF0157 family)
MPPPLKVELVAHDPHWAAAATAEGERLGAALGPTLLAVHHIGSTAIPTIVAKPILDLMPVVASLEHLDECRRILEGLGYEWWGEYGLVQRRYCTRDDPDTRRRLVQLHCYASGCEEITRHVAFRDYLRSRPDLAREYEREKRRCRALHPDDSHAYGACKGDWITPIEKQALAWRAAQ